MIKVTLFLLVFLFSVPAYAFQNENVLEYGDVVFGEITNREFEVEYSFQGSEMDIVVVELFPDQGLDELQPNLILLNEDFDVLLSVDGLFSSATLIYPLPADGEYFILATRTDGRSGESEGNYRLELNTVPILQPDTAIHGSATTDNSSYYAVITSSDFAISYEYITGEFLPEITVNGLEDGLFSSSNLTPIAAMNGDNLKSGVLGVSVGNTNGDCLLIVAVGRGTFQYSFDDETVSYSLMLTDTDVSG